MEVYYTMVNIHEDGVVPTEVIEDMREFINECDIAMHMMLFMACAMFYVFVCYLRAKSQTVVVQEAVPITDGTEVRERVEEKE